MAGFVPLMRHFTAPAPAEPTPELPLPRLTPPAPVIDLEAEKRAAYEAGRADAQREAASVVAELEARLAASVPLLAEVERARKAALDQASDDVAKLVVELARRVLGDSLALHPDALPGLVRAALDRLPDEDEVWIRVPPVAVERVAAVVPERHRSRVVPDPALSTGCVVETRHVAIDASIEAAMQGITEATSAWRASAP
jgi:flagellar assembly protein FliH